MRSIRPMMLAALLRFFAAKVTKLLNPFERLVKCFYNAHRYTHIDC